MSVDSQTAQLERAIKLWPVTKEDEAFLLEVYASTRSEEMALVPWTDEQRRAFVAMQFKAQQEHYGQYYPHASHDIILESGKPVGRLYVDRLEHEINIIDLTMLPQERNAGIGSYLLRGILKEAGRSSKPVGIFVENFNPSRRLFERLGFLETEESGIHLHLQWFPGETRNVHTTASEPPPNAQGDPQNS